MTFRIPVPAGLVAALAVGCSSAPDLKPGAVPVKGVVRKADGTPVTNLTLSILATNCDQTPAAAALKKDGRFDVKLIPGKYTFMFEGSPAALKTVPAKYHSNNEVNSFEVPPGGKADLTVKLEG